MALPADTPLTATALATALVSIGLASLVWQRRVARLERLRRQITAIRQVSRQVLRAPDEASAAALMEEELRRILADRSLKVAIGRAGSSAKRAALPPYHLRFSLNPQENQQEFLEIWHSNERGFSPEIREALEEDIQEELAHARRFGERIKELYGVVPGSLEFKAEQSYLQPPEHQTDVVHVIRGVIEAETAAIEHYNAIIEFCEGKDYVTQDMVIEILHEEEAHRRLFEGFLREYEAEGLA